MHDLERPTLEARIRLRLARIVRALAGFIWAITGGPLERLSLALWPPAVHCPACWRFQRTAKDGTVTVKHKRGCDYVRLLQNEKAWEGYPPAV